MHGRRAVDFRHILAADEDRAAGFARVASLDLWRTPVVACTVDTVLGVIQNNRRGLMAWPALAQGGFVFDEVHSYDDKLFGALLTFLREVRGVPTLLMTASLPAARLDAIRAALPEGEALAEVEGPTDLESLPRYRRVGTKNPHGEIVETLKAGGKVLRVCNTVAAAVREAEALRDAVPGVEPLIYHSRFRYVDRVRRHDAVVKAFDGKGPVLACCTQVAEMSLDLSADLLVTDQAPVPSLIQRLGRLNRRTPPADPAKGGRFVVTPPLGRDGKPSPLPYAQDELDEADAWLKDLGDGDLSQAGLAAAWERMQEAAGDDAVPPQVESAWLDGGPVTAVHELRDGSPGVTVVLERDLPGLRDGSLTVAEVAVPMPVPQAKVGGHPFDWQATIGVKHPRPLDYHGLPVAKDHAVSYDPLVGAFWSTGGSNAA